MTGSEISIVGLLTAVLVNMVYIGLVLASINDKLREIANIPAKKSIFNWKRDIVERDRDLYNEAWEGDPDPNQRINTIGG